MMSFMPVPAMLKRSALVPTLLALVVVSSQAQTRKTPSQPGPAPSTTTCKAADASFFRDEAMTMKVATKLQFNKELLREKIAVKVSGGVATLSGAVTTAELASTAGKLAGQVEGIRCVNNQLTVGVGS
jgi:hypothetical protein